MSNTLQISLDRYDERLRLGRRSDGNAKIILHRGITEPPNQALLVAQLLEPRFRGELRWPDENKIGLARKYVKAEPPEFMAECFARGDDSAEVRPVIGQALQRRQGRDLAEAVDVVAIADFVERGDEFRMADEVSDTLEAKRVGLRESPRDDHVWIVDGEFHRIRLCEIHVSLVQDHHPSLRSP